jgi:hypothetical protein
MMQSLTASRPFLPLIFLFTLAANAAKPTQSDTLSLSGPIGAAKGSTTVATPASYDNALLNVAAAAPNKQYNVGVGFLSGARTMLASIVDTKSSALGGSVYFARRENKRGSLGNESLGSFRRLENRVGFALFGRVSEEVSFGAGAKWVQIKPHNEPGLNKASLWNGDLGLFYQPLEELRLGLSSSNFLDDEKDYLPTSIQVGVDYVFAKALTLSALVLRYDELDASAALRRPTGNVMVWAVGAEYLIRDFSLRSGFRDNQPWDEHLWGVGLGYGAHRFRADYAAEIPVKGGGQVLHDLSIALLF